MSDLPGRLEAASADQQGKLIREVVEHAKDAGWIDLTTYHFAVECICIGAFVDAAISLVPEGMWWIINSGVNDGFATAILGLRRNYADLEARAPAPCLALCAAIIRARSE